MQREVTNDWLERNRTMNGGYTAAQLKVLGVAWPPQRGWKRQVIGRRIDERIAQKFEAIGRGR